MLKNVWQRLMVGKKYVFLAEWSKLEISPEKIKFPLLNIFRFQVSTTNNNRRKLFLAGGIFPNTQMSSQFRNSF